MHDLDPETALSKLLDDADSAEAGYAGRGGPSPEFDGVMREILATSLTPLDGPGEELAVVPPIVPPTAAATPVIIDRPSFAVVAESGRHSARSVDLPIPPAPKLATRPGDLVFVFGLREDALTVGQAFALGTPTIEVAVAGAIGRPGSRHVGTRREALQARADGVRRGGSTVVAIGAGLAPTDAEQHIEMLAEVQPDQVWIAVDATRKPEDTRAWAHLVAEAAGGIDAVAAIGLAYTTTPDSLGLLGIPVGWADGRTEL